MDSLSYYPGCTLKTKAANFERSALAVLRHAGVEVTELKDWTCCGAVFSQTQDSLMYQVAPIRTLIRARESGNSRLLTLCSMCYNTLKRAALFVEADEERSETLNSLMDLEETEYRPGDVDVVHILNVLDELGEDRIRELSDGDGCEIKVAPYYGCLLLRPQEVAVDKMEDPDIMERILAAAGLDPVYFPFRNECCSAYHVVSREAIAEDRTRKIVGSAVKNGADVIAVSCPLCSYNLDAMQKRILSEDSTFQTVPILYLTQLMAMRMGLGADEQDFSLHYVDPRPVLKEKGLL